VIGANDDRLQRSLQLRAEPWVDVSAAARSRRLAAPFDYPVSVSSELWTSLRRIPFRDIRSVTVCSRLREVLTRAAAAVERLRQEHCMKRGEDWPPERRLGLRFAAQIPIDSVGPRFRHLCLVIGPGANRAPILRIGEAHQLCEILKPPVRKPLRPGMRPTALFAPFHEARALGVTRDFACPPHVIRSPTHSLSTPRRAQSEAVRSLPCSGLGGTIAMSCHGEQRGGTAGKG
jgi:hypothetical protein